MAWAFGTCSDYNDFLTKIIDYASGSNPSGFSGSWTSSGVVPSGQQWTVQSNSIPSSGSLITVGTAYLVGPGSTSGDNVTVGLQTYNNAGAAIYGVQLAAYTEYDSSLGFTTMPGASPISYVTLSGSSFTGYIYVNGRRIMAVARIGGLYDVVFHLGFFLQYGTHSQYPYPMLVAGTVPNPNYPVSEADYGNSGLPDPGYAGGTAFRWIDGSWQNISHYNQQLPISRSNSAFVLYPMRDLSNTDSAETYIGYCEVNLFGNWSVGGVQLSSLEISDYCLFPVVLHSGTQMVGQIDGMYQVNGNGLSPGDTITSGGVTYDVFHQTWRSSPDCYYCIARS
jgi:hypothetical protein